MAFSQVAIVDTGEGTGQGFHPKHTSRLIVEATQISLHNL